MVKRKRNQIVLRKKNQIILRGGEWTNPLSQLFSGITNFFFNFTRLFSNFIVSMNPLNWSSVQAMKDKGKQAIGSATRVMSKGKEELGESFNGLKSSVGERINTVKEKVKSVDKKAEDSYNNLGKTSEIRNASTVNQEQFGGYRKKTKKMKKRKTRRRKKRMKRNKTIKRRRTKRR